MADQQYYHAQRGQKRGQSGVSSSNWKHPSYPGYQSRSGSSDYISRPVYSNSDYISKRPSNGDVSCHDFEHQSPQSDYISRPYESIDDYLLEYNYEIDPSVAPDRESKSTRQDHSSSWTAGSFSMPNCHTETPPLSSHSYWPAELGTQRDRSREVSDYQLIKEGGWNHGFDLMRSHGLRTWEHEDHEEAKEILNGFRKIDAQNACPPELEYSGRAGASAVYGTNDMYGKGNSWNDLNHGQEDIYTNDSDVSSYRSGYESGLASPISPTACSDISAHESSDDDSDYASYGEDSASDVIRDLSDFASDDEDGVDDGDDDDDDDDAVDRSDRSDVDSIGSSDVASLSGDDDRSGNEGSDAEDGDDHVEDGYDGYDEDEDEDDS